MNAVVGWDVGGVNTKAALVRGGRVLDVRVHPFELQRAPEALAPLLFQIGSEMGADSTARHAVTMTAELSQMFRTKREGVAFILDAVQAVVPADRVHVFGVDGRFRTVEAARMDPLRVAASNWVATAWQVATRHADALLVDVGTTTTDIIPIVGGRVVAEGYTDPDRLATGELVYTGVVRSPIESLVGEVTVRGRTIGVSAEGFALTGDVHVWRGDLASSDYATQTPDGRPVTRPYVWERLARVICADREMLADEDVSDIADAVAQAQTERIASALARVHARHPAVRTVLTAGIGAFLAAAAARMRGLQVESLSASMGAEAARCAPAAAVALLLDREPPARDERASGGVEPLCVGRRDALAPAPIHSRDALVVVKVGGGMLANVEAWLRVLAVIDETDEADILVVPGGGPFADTVRDMDRLLGLEPTVSHWMAVTAMEQYGQLLASRMRRAVLVEEAAEIEAALARGRVPVLLPARWLRRVDPLPHAWEVTSDSIAAWVAGAIGAGRLVVVKPAGATGDDLMDAHFRQALPPGVTAVAVPASNPDALRRVLSARNNSEFQTQNLR